jgi:hypothetical protein
MRLVPSALTHRILTIETLSKFPLELVSLTLTRKIVQIKQILAYFIVLLNLVTTFLTGRRNRKLRPAYIMLIVKARLE